MPNVKESSLLQKKQQLDNRYNCCFLSATAAAGNVFVQLDFAASIRQRSVAVRVCDESGDIDWVKDGGCREVMWLRGAVPAGSLCVPTGLRLRSIVRALISHIFPSVPALTKLIRALAC